MSDLIATAQRAFSALFDSRTRFPLWIIPPLLLFDAALTSVVILKVPYTEIDWTAYMQQVTQYLSGERDYTAIRGGTGPLVYPAAHVYIYSALYRLTAQGVDILRAQWIFMALYLVTLALVLLCYREARAPMYILPFLMLSKRLHSIYVLRLFNDPWAVLLQWLAIYCWQKRVWTLGAFAYSLAVGVKMNSLLLLPAVGAMYLQAVGRNKALRQALIMGQIQVLIATPFLLEFPKSYLSRAFEFTRQFMYKWTVNWRFVPEDIFLSRPFALGLLGLHAALLLVFMFTKWIRPSRRSIPGFLALIISPPDQDGLEARQISARVSPRFVLTSLLTANTIGMLCARSLHYQFYSWLAWGTPYLLWRSGLGPAWVAVLWLAQEWAWNVYPSTNASSGVVVGVLALTVLGALVGVRDEQIPQKPSAEKAKKTQ